MRLADTQYISYDGLSTRSYCISTGNYFQYPMINHKEKLYEKECKYIYNQITYCTVVINTTL